MGRGCLCSVICAWKFQSRKCLTSGGGRISWKHPCSCWQMLLLPAGASAGLSAGAPLMATPCGRHVGDLGFLTTWGPSSKNEQPVKGRQKPIVFLCSGLRSHMATVLPYSFSQGNHKGPPSFGGGGNTDPTAREGVSSSRWRKSTWMGDNHCSQL